MTHTFQNKVVFILGGTGSVGSAIGDAFQKEDATVCRHGLSGGEYKADVTQDGAVKEMIRNIYATHGRIDILVNALSAPADIAPFEKRSWKDFEKHLEIQFKAAVESAESVLPLMKEKKSGRIVTILTTYTERVPASLSPYIATKFGLLGFTKALAKEVGKFGITVNAVSPGTIDNEFTKNAPEKLKEIIVYETPLGRLTTPHDVADAVLFLSSDEAGFITGVNLCVDGGYSL